MDFGKALVELKAGKKISRSGWNGKGMWLVLLTPATKELPGRAHGFNVDPCIAMKTAGNTLQPGWLANQADMLAEDWGVVPE